MVAELDVFTYDADKPAISRFHAAKKKLSTYLGSRFGFNAHIIDHLEEYHFEEPEQPDEEELDHDPYNFTRRKYEKKLDAYLARVEEYNSNKPKVYAVIWVSAL